MSNSGWIAVDLDGTLARYDGWQGPTHVGAPIPKMVERVKRWLKKGYEVRIFTARVGPQPAHVDVEIIRKAIRLWCITHIGQELPITATKDFSMWRQYDDRAVQIELNTGERVDGQEDEV